jgi:glutaredoxin 3
MADRVMNIASERAVVVFTKSTCCMCHTVTQLMTDLAVNALVHELDSDPRGKEMERALIKMLGGRGPAVPAVFIGRRLVGGTKNVMALHLAGELKPMLTNAGALWV